MAQYILVQEKGMIALSTGYFLQLYEARQRDLLQAQLVKSSIDTNYWVKRASIIGTVIAAITGFYIVRDATSSSKKNPSHIDTPLQKTAQLLDSMKQSQRGIDSYLQKVVKDSFYQKRP